MINEALVNRIKEFNQVLVSGLEGSGKSRDILVSVLNSDILDFNTQYAIYCTTSYSLLFEKQEELIRYQGLTKEECPVLTFTDFEDLSMDNKKYFNNETTSTYTKDAKIILMTLAAVQRCHHLNIMPASRLDCKNFGMLIVDEFDFTSSIIPRLDYLVASIMSGSKSKKSITDFIRSEYSPYDYELYKRAVRERNSKYLIAHYIDRNKTFGVKTIFISSEKIPQLLLGNIEFSIFEMPESKFEHTIYYKSDMVNTHTFNRLNNENKWSIFGFDKIISDRYDPIYTLKHEIEVINHIKCRGSNKFDCSTPLLSIISHVPKSVIQNITAALNELDKNPLDANDEYKFEDIKNLYYRDRLYQAVGRVIGHRGERSGCDKTWVLISDTIMNSLLESGDIAENYKLAPWDFNNDTWTELVDNVRNDSRINDSCKKNLRTKNNEENIAKNKTYARDVINKFIEVGDEKDYIIFEDIKKMFNTWGVTKVRPKFIYNHFKSFGVVLKQKQINNKVHNAIWGIRFKSNVPAMVG
jgi:hypothetical protein